MKKTWLLALVFLILCENVSFFAHATTKNEQIHTPVCMTVNGQYIKSDSPAYLKDGITLVPIRALSDALCADSVTWDKKTQTATIQKQNTVITLKKDKKTADVNGKNVSLGAPATITNDRLYVPVRFVAETFRAHVDWDKATYTVSVTLDGITVPQHVIGKKPYADQDLYWLSRIIHAESQGEPMNGKIGVANVVLNRVESPLYDDTIYDVIFDTKYGVQFTPVLNGAIYNTPLGDSVVAAKRALSGENHAGESLYFLNPDIATNFWIIKNRTFYKSIGRHDFYL